MSHYIIEKIQDIDDAILIATIAHGDQKDLRGRPYIFHPIRVAEAVHMAGLSEEAVIAAALHDTVEDTEMVIELLEDLAGARVAFLVDLLSRREGQTYDQFIYRIVQSGDTEAARIKICDIEDNLREDRRLGDENEISRRKRYHDARDTLWDFLSGVEYEMD